MEKRVTPPKRVTSPTWGPPPSCKQALSDLWTFVFVQRQILLCKLPQIFQFITLSYENVLMRLYYYYFFTIDLFNLYSLFSQ